MHEKGGVIVIDAAQSAPHIPVDVQALDADFLVFSGHKLMEPMGIGVLYGNAALLDALPPFLTGGEMIDSVSRESAVFAELPHKFEAGTVNGGGAVGLQAAIDYLMNVGFDEVQKREELLTRIPEQIIDAAAAMRDYISVVPEAAVAVNAGVTAMHDVTEGGIFGALWEVGEASGVGIIADLDKIPIRQETIELCEFYDINPYMLISSGSMLIGTPHGNKLVDELAEQGIPAAVIGRATEGNDRIIRSGEETRFLEPAGSEQLYKIYQ